MLCPTCGQTVTQGSRFCMHCGSPVTVTETEDKTVTEDLEARSWNLQQTFMKPRF